ncbi:MAG: hypothetical protein QM654_06815 [Dysgonamonadaceae bacterium]
MDRRPLLSFEYIAFIILIFKDIRCYSDMKIYGYYIGTTGLIFLPYTLPAALDASLCPVCLLRQCSPAFYRIGFLLHDIHNCIPVALSALEPRVLLSVSRYRY